MSPRSPASSASASSASASSASAGAVREAVFYRYEDEQGRVVVVDDASRLPPAARGRAERLVLGGSDPVGDPRLVQTDEGKWLLSNTGDPEPAGWQWHQRSDPGSFAVGFGLGLLAGGALFGLWARRARGRGVPGLLFGVVLVIAAAVLIVGAYLGWLRRTAGRGSGAFASPAELIEDARDTVREVEERQRAQERQLDEIKRLAK